MLNLKKTGFISAIYRETEIPKTVSFVNPVIIEMIAMLSVAILACTENNVKNRSSSFSTFSIIKSASGITDKSARNEVTITIAQSNIKQTSCTLLEHKKFRILVFINTPLMYRFILIIAK